MPSNNDAWGIEVGANAIKALRLTRTGDQVRVSEYEVLPFKKILTTPDINADEAIQVGLDHLMNKHQMRKSVIVASVPGHMAFARFAKLPPVEPKKIGEIVKYEAIQQIPFPLEQVEWDYQVFQEEDSPEVEVGIFAITKDRVMKFLSDYQEVGLAVDALTLSPLGVYNALSYDLNLNEQAPGTIFVDIGTSSTDVIIVEGGGIWLRTLPTGGNNFTEALVKAFKLTFPKAEKLKREAGTSKYARQIFQAMRPVFADLVQEIQRSLGYYQSLNRDAELKRLIGVGSTFRLPGLTKFLKQQLQLDVKKLDGFQRAETEPKRASELAEHAINLATAYGLALQGLGLGRVEANILPSHILSQRMWRSKQPIFAAAAALVVLASGLSYFRVASEQSAYEQAQEGVKITQALNVAREQTKEIDGILEKDDPITRMTNLYRTADYRDVWPKMMADLSGALTQLQTQEELTASPPNDAKIEQAAIPRDQRRQVLITSYQVEYWPDGKGPVRPGAAARRNPMGYDEEEGEDEEAAAPRFKVMVQGVTPYHDANGLIGQFTRAIAQSTQEVNRPYRVVPGSVGIPFLNPVGAAATLIEPGAEASGVMTPATRARRRTPTRRVQPNFNSGMMDPMTAMMMGGGDMMQPGGMMGGLGGMRPGALGALTPQPPEIYYTHKNDTQFTVEWFVELLPPNEARLMEDPAYRPPVEESPDDEQMQDADAESARGDDLSQEDRS